jgi:protein SCO1/2
MSVLPGPKPSSPDGSRAPISGRFSLVDHNGRCVTEASFAGLWLLVFFGFTHCRVVCPRALKRIDDALAFLGPGADAIQPLYITVDPARDTPDVMRNYLHDAHPRVLGLTGDDAAVQAAKKAFLVFSRRMEDTDDPDGYAMPHTAFTYLIDKAGAYRAHFPDTISVNELAERLRRHLG